MRIGLIGAGKFGAMYLAQVPDHTGQSISPRSPTSRRRAPESIWRAAAGRRSASAGSIADAFIAASTYVGEDWKAWLRTPRSTSCVGMHGRPDCGGRACLEAFAHGKNVVNVTVEADAFCGPLLARKAAESGVIYSLAFGDQPALICDLIDWARACGLRRRRRGTRPQVAAAFRAVDAGNGVGSLRPDDEQARVGGLNPKMFNSFLDGSKPSIESTAVCNATGLTAPADGLSYPPGSIDDIPSICRPPPKADSSIRRARSR